MRELCTTDCILDKFSSVPILSQFNSKMGTKKVMEECAPYSTYHDSPSCCTFSNAMSEFLMILFYAMLTVLYRS